jgi:D-aminopeptidase
MPSKTVAIAFDEKKIDAIFADLDQSHLPGAAVGVSIDGTPVYRRGFGLANMELPVVLSPHIRMRIASTTKHFAALAYLLLCEDGQAAIDDPIGKYLPELHPVTHAVTVRQLMGHVGGLRDVFDVLHQFSGHGRRVTSAEFLSLYRDIDDVSAAPGTRWSYNNGGYMMLGAAIERITGQPLEEVLRRRIFAPVGMNDTLLRHFDTDFVPNSATQHMTNPAGEFEKSYIGSATDAAGGMVSTVDDLLRWLAHMDAPKVGTPATWTLMKAPLILANGVSTGYGLGLMSGSRQGFDTLGHAGNLPGSSSQMLKVPAAGLDLVVLINRNDVSAPVLADRILKACLPGSEAARPPSNGRFAAGTYRSPTTGRVIQLAAAPSPYVANGAALQIAAIDTGELPVEPCADGALRPAGAYDFMKLAVTLIGDPQTPSAVRLSDFGDVDELLPAPPAEDVDVGAIAGRYRADGAGVEATISATDDGARLTTVTAFGSAEFTLEQIAAGLWRARSTGLMPWGGILSFDPAGFRFSSFRTPGLPFRRCEPPPAARAAR